jgi:hypothetical protein
MLIKFMAVQQYLPFKHVNPSQLSENYTLGGSNAET